MMAKALVEIYKDHVQRDSLCTISTRSTVAVRPPPIAMHQIKVGISSIIYGSVKGEYDNSKVKLKKILPTIQTDSSILYNQTEYKKLTN